MTTSIPGANQISCWYLAYTAERTTTTILSPAIASTYKLRGQPRPRRAKPQNNSHSHSHPHPIPILTIYHCIPSSNIYVYFEVSFSGVIITTFIILQLFSQFQMKLSSIGFHHNVIEQNQYNIVPISLRENQSTSQQNPDRISTISFPYPLRKSFQHPSNTITKFISKSSSPSCREDS